APLFLACRCPACDTEKKDYICAFNPKNIQSYLDAWAKPIIAVMDSEGVRIVE
ncbi:unnamed protein product, partial [marine sediment metagenome]